MLYTYISFQIVGRVLGQHHIQRSAKSKHSYYLKKNRNSKYQLL